MSVNPSTSEDPGVDASFRDAPVLPLSSARVLLRPPDSMDHQTLRQAELSEHLSRRWRFQGAIPSPEEYVAGLWRGTLCQFLVHRLPDSEIVGMVTAYGADFRNGHCKIAGAKFDPADRSSSFLEGGMLFLNYLFGMWDFHKLYLESPEYNMNQIASGIGKLMTVEGRLRNHFVVGTERYDQILLSITRETWEARVKRFAR